MKIGVVLKLLYNSEIFLFVLKYSFICLKSFDCFLYEFSISFNLKLLANSKYLKARSLLSISK